MIKRNKLAVFVLALFVVLAVTMNSVPLEKRRNDWYSDDFDSESLDQMPYFQSVAERVESEGWKISRRTCLTESFLAIRHTIVYAQVGYPFTIREKVQIYNCGPAYKSAINLNNLALNSLIALLASAGLGLMVHSASSVIKKKA